MKLPGIFVFLFLLCTVAYSQDLDYAKTIVKKLTSPELQGRGYTGKGDQLAAAFIADEFKSMGLLPLAKTYYQKFNISINTFPGALSLKLNDEALTPGVDYLVESSSPSIKGMFDIVKTSRKELDSEQKLIELIKILPGKFVLIDNTVKSENKELNKTIDDYISFLKYSPDIACKGIIIFTKEKLTWENSTFQNVRPIIVVNKELDLKNVSKIEIIVESKFIEKYETQNVAAYIKGSLNPDSFIVVTAHYDHLGKMGSEALFPGANDNASGVAMMLNLAKHYAQNPPEYSMVFIALSAEEVGLLGAKEFTEHPLIKLKNIRFLVNFDLAGTGDEGIRVVNGSVFKSKFDLLTRLNTEGNLLPKIDIRGEACISDHCLFYQKGVPCFYIYTQGGIKAYHDVYDKYETLPLTEFVDYCSLMIKFFDEI